MLLKYLKHFHSSFLPLSFIFSFLFFFFRLKKQTRAILRCIFDLHSHQYVCVISWEELFYGQDFLFECFHKSRLSFKKVEKMLLPSLNIVCCFITCLQCLLFCVTQSLLNVTLVEYHLLHSLLFILFIPLSGKTSVMQCILTKGHWGTTCL